MYSSSVTDRRRSTLDELPSARGSEFGSKEHINAFCAVLSSPIMRNVYLVALFLIIRTAMHSDSKAKKTVRGSRFGGIHECI